MNREIEEKLKAPFPVEDIQWRIARSGKTQKGVAWAMVLAYVDARAVMDRLDEVFGYDGWFPEYTHLPNGVMCRLTVSTEKGYVCKSDGSPETAVEAFKGGISKALVRTASVYGIGRYLYNLTENFAKVTLEQPDFKERDLWNTAKLKSGETIYWQPPTLPKWALPQPPESTVSDSEPELKVDINLKIRSLITKITNNDANELIDLYKTLGVENLNQILNATPQTKEMILNQLEDMK